MTGRKDAQEGSRHSIGEGEGLGGIQAKARGSGLGTGGQ